MVVKDSAASRNSVVEMALSLSASTGTSTKERLKVESRVAPSGTAGADMVDEAPIVDSEDAK